MQLVKESESHQMSRGEEIAFYVWYFIVCAMVTTVMVFVGTKAGMPMAQLFLLGTFGTLLFVALLAIKLIDNLRQYGRLVLLSPD